MELRLDEFSTNQRPMKQISAYNRQVEIINSNLMSRVLFLYLLQNYTGLSCSTAAYLAKETDMGEIDTKSIESVQAALCYFSEKNEPKKLRSPSRDVRANVLAAKLEECEAERDAYMGCLTKSKGQKQKLEIEMNKMDARELSSFSEDAAAEALETVDLLRTKLEAEERKNSEQLLYIESLDMELGLIEIAVLKSDLHKARSEAAAAAASEARGNNVRSGLCLAVKQLAIEAEEAKRQTLKLKQGDFCVTKISPEDENFTFQSVGGSESDNFITISLEEYQSLLAKAEKQSTILAIEVNNELQVLKKEHEAAVIKVNEFRTRAEQAVTRAESAERAKVAVEGQLRKWREQKQRRKAAQASLKEETLHSQSYHQAIYDDDDDDDKPVGKYQPLGKVLNMEF
ncbi:hypothetical protein QQ045_033304 [Rhodiola kirilowii]